MQPLDSTLRYSLREACFVISHWTALLRLGVMRPDDLKMLTYAAGQEVPRHVPQGQGEEESRENSANATSGSLLM